jgi:uncharacterized membrane protein YfcA
VSRVVFSALLLGLFLLIGGVIGFLSGLLGIGGGSFMIPALVAIFGATLPSGDLAVKMAFGTNLVVGALTALTGFTVHSRHLSHQWRTVLPLAGTSIVGALCGSTLASHLSGQLLRVFFGVAVMIVAGSMFLRRENEGRPAPILPLGLLLPLGLAIGFSASLVGLGGAVFTTIVLVSVLKYPMRQVVGVSTFVQSAGALFGAVGYMLNGLGKPGLPPFSVGYVNLAVAGAMMVTGIPLARLGATYTHRINATALKRVFAVALLVIAVLMIGGVGRR